MTWRYGRKKSVFSGSKAVYSPLRRRFSLPPQCTGYDLHRESIRPTEPEELRRLLKDAHGEIEQLRSESDEYMNAISDLFDGQNALEMQVLQMNEQIAELEGMLKISDSELADAMIGLSALQEAFQKLRSTAASTLETARSATSRVQMTASMYELASSTEMADEVEIVDVSRQQMAALRNRLRR